MASLIRTVETGHEEMIHDASMNYYGILLATCSSDGVVKVFDTKTSVPREIACLKDHEGPVWQLAWAHPMYGNMFASCSYDKKIIIWREVNGIWAKHYEYAGHSSSVNSVCWAPNHYGLILAAASSDSSISILTLQPDKSWTDYKIPNAHDIGCNSISWAPYRTNSPQRLVSGGCDNRVKIWRDSLDKGWENEKVLEGHYDWVRDAAWAPNNDDTDIIASCSQDGQAIIWKGDNQGQWTSVVMEKFEDVVWHVSWSLTGNLLAVSGGDNKVSLWKESIDGKWIKINDVDSNEEPMMHGPAETFARQADVALSH